MRISNILTLSWILFLILQSCEKDKIKPSALYDFNQNHYFDSEVFPPSHISIYGKWRIVDVSGGFHGGGYEPDFEYLEIKEYGMYGFIRNDSLLEYGKIYPTLQTSNDWRLKITFEKDESSGTFFTDTEKYTEIQGSDTLHLSSPCCDRYNYHFVRED